MAKKSSPKAKSLPTPAEQKAFARKLSKSDWSMLCEFPSFVEAVQENLKRAEDIAYQILRGTWEEPDETHEKL